jgi:DNA-binding SARP family transcriptional activator
LWPGSEERRARTDLRSALAKLRKALRDSAPPGKEARFFVVEGDLSGVEPREVELDLEALGAAVSLARSETSLGGTSADAAGAPRHRELIGRLEEAVGLYRGEFMEGFPEGRWR